MNGNYYLLTNLLSEDETRVITGIVDHIESSDERLSITQLADDYFVSPSFIVKMCKRLGFKGYSELFYNLSQRIRHNHAQETNFKLASLIDNYSESSVHQFCSYLRQYHDRKLFVVGAGFSDLVAGYIVQRLGVSGFMVFNRVHFYDYMLFRDNNRHHMHSNIEPSVIIAISQSGETDNILNDVVRARQNGFKVILFTKRADSTMAKLANITFVVDEAKQTLISTVPNTFFGKIILTFEELLGSYFAAELATGERLAT